MDTTISFVGPTIAVNIIRNSSLITERFKRVLKLMGYEMDICRVAALRIRKMRIEKNMSIDDLAEKCDVSTQTIKIIEGGKRNFKIKTLYKIANSLNVSSDYLIGRIDTPTPESTVVGDLISNLTKEEVAYLILVLSNYVEILKKAETDNSENSSV